MIKNLKIKEITAMQLLHGDLLPARTAG